MCCHPRVDQMAIPPNPASSSISQFKNIDALLQSTPEASLVASSRLMSSSKADKLAGLRSSLSGMADSTQGEARSNGRGSGGLYARAQAAAAFAITGYNAARRTWVEAPVARAQAMAAAIAQARAPYAHARAYAHAMAYARIQAYVSQAVKASGLLALLLSSVVLLGGFIESLVSLGKKDFWCVTAITVIQAAGIFEDWENSAEYFVGGMESANALLEELNLLLGSFTLRGILLSPLYLPLVLLFSVVTMCLNLILLFGPFASLAISAWRMAKLNHGRRDGTDSMMAALNLFHSLVIFQGTMFGVLILILDLGEWTMARHLHGVEQLQSEKWVKKAIRKYLSDTSKKWRKNPESIKGRDLIKYAVELLDSESQEDYLYGARLLGAFVKKQGEDVRSLLLPSTHKIQKLIESLRISSSLDEAYVKFYSRINSPVMSNLDDNREIRELAAAIVADLAGHIDLAKYPESMRYISSLLLQEETKTSQTTYRTMEQVPYPQRRIGPLTEEEQRGQDFRQQLVLKAMEIEKRRQWKLVRDQKRMTRREERCPKNREGDASYELILQGLTILDRLACNKDNCSLICSAPGLLPKITAPVYSETLIQDVTNKAWSDIVTRSLKLLHKLIRAPEPISMSLRQDISSNVQALSNLKGILNVSSEAGQELQLPTKDILTELAVDFSINLDRETKETLITKQRKVFLDSGEGGESATIAGKTLESLSENKSDLIMNTRKDITDRLARETIEILITKQLQVFFDNGEGQESAAVAGKTLVSLSTSSGSNSALIMAAQKDIVYRLTGLLDAKNTTAHRTISAEIMENLCAHSYVDKKYMKEILLPKVLQEIVSFKRESQQGKISPGQNNSAPGDEENQRDSESGKDTAWKGYKNKLSDQGSEEQEAFLSLTLAISNKLNSDDFDDAIENTSRGREEFVDKLKSLIDDNCEAAPGSLRIVKLCFRIAESTMQCQQYQQYADFFRNKGFEISLSEASETMSRLESCMLFHGTDFGLKKTVRPLISSIQLKRKTLSTASL